MKRAENMFSGRSEVKGRPMLIAWEGPKISKSRLKISRSYFRMKRAKNVVWTRFEVKGQPMPLTWVD